MIDVDPEFHARHVHQAFREETSGNQKRHRDGDLRGRERAAEPRGGARAGRLTGLALQCRQEIRTRAVECGKKTEQQAGAGGQRRGKQGNRRVDPGLKRGCRLRR